MLSERSTHRNSASLQLESITGHVAEGPVRLLHVVPRAVLIVEGSVVIDLNRAQVVVSVGPETVTCDMVSQVTDFLHLMTHAYSEFPRVPLGVAHQGFDSSVGSVKQATTHRVVTANDNGGMCQLRWRCKAQLRLRWAETYL